MKHTISITNMIVLLSLSLGIASCTEKKQPSTTQKMAVQIILGSTRQGRTSDKIAQLLKNIAEKRTDIAVDVVDLRDYDLPFMNDEIVPARRTTLTDERVRAWSNKVSAADAFIFVVPEYNAGYPGVLKNALDSLYKEWNNKPVALVGYSGGPSGGSCALTQLRQTLDALKMYPVSGDIKIPQAWKAFDAYGNFVDKNIEALLNRMIDQMIAAYARKE